MAQALMGGLLGGPGWSVVARALLGGPGWSIVARALMGAPKMECHGPESAGGTQYGAPWPRVCSPCLGSHGDDNTGGSAGPWPASTPCPAHRRAKASRQNPLPTQHWEMKGLRAAMNMALGTGAAPACACDLRVETQEGCPGASPRTTGSWDGACPAHPLSSRVELAAWRSASEAASTHFSGRGLPESLPSFSNLFLQQTPPIWEPGLQIPWRVLISS